MGMWDEWKDNISKGFRFVALASDSMDVMSLLQGKTPDQIADEKTRASTENDELSQFDPLFMENFQLDSGREDEILDGDDSFFDNLGDLIGNTAAKFKVNYDDLTDNILNIILDQFDEQTLGEKFGHMDPSMLDPSLLASMGTEAELKRQAKESGQYASDSALTWGPDGRGLMGLLENLGGTIASTAAGAGAPATYADTGSYGIQQRRIDKEKIDYINNTLLDPGDPSATGEILEDVARMAAEGDVNVDILRAWIESPAFGRGLDPGDVRRMYGTLDSLVDQIMPLVDHLDEVSTGHRLPPAMYEALTVPGIATGDPIVEMYKKALQTGGPGVNNIPLGDTTPSAHPLLHGNGDMGTSQPSVSVTDGGDTTTIATQGENLLALGSDAATAGHPSREMTQDELMQQITYLSDAEDATLETTLEEVFYTTAFQMPNAGRFEVRRELPGLFTTTSILFELYNPDIHQIFPKDEEGRSYDDPDWTGVAGKTKWDAVGKAFGAFLNDFLQPGGRAKYMGQLQESIETLNTYLARGEQGELYRGSDGVTDMDIWANAVMTKPGYLRNLAKLYSTGGKMGYTASRIHGYLDELANYWEKMGMSEAEIFRKLTARHTERQDDTDADRILDGDIGSPGELNVPTEAPTVDLFDAELSKIMNSGQFAGMGGHPSDLQTQPTSNVVGGRSGARTDERVLEDAIRANLRRTGRGSVDSGIRPDTSVKQRAVKGLSQEHLESMPLAFNDAENRKRMKGLPYVQLYVKDGKRVRGTTFVPTRGWKASAGTERRKARLMEELKQA